MTTRRLTISLPETLFDEVERLSQREHRTLSELAREALRRYTEEAQPTEEAVQPWERELVAQRLAAHRRNPQAVFDADEVHAELAEEIRRIRQEK
ncbi:MAG: ribbon-helix-helix protein, CopG family [Acidobacteriota bacterium]|nr:ribbon-helix-helix protein, CopG family [Acidobacteriota bacterium]